MVKNIRATLDEDDYEEMTRIKGSNTWLYVLRRGIDSIEAYPEDEGWKKHMKHVLKEVKE